jgi:hypothetical protein
MVSVAEKVRGAPFRVMVVAPAVTIPVNSKSTLIRIGSFFMAVALFSLKSC